MFVKPSEACITLQTKARDKTFLTFKQSVFFQHK